MKIATWNVNSIKARLPNALEWLGEFQPDIVCLQELKCVTEAFPYTEIEELGYNCAVHGQKTYNGVAILSKHSIDEVTTTELPGAPKAEEARYIEALISADGEALRVASVYVPNGQSPDSDRFPQKLEFFEKLHDHAQTLLQYEEKLIIAGDFNVAPTDIDVYDANHLRDTTCFHPEEQRRWRAIEYGGLTDAWRAMHPGKQAYSWWDYRGGGWQQNKGMRIDHLLLSPQAADVANDAGIEEDTRGKDKASDHAPVWCELGLRPSE